MVESLSEAAYRVLKSAILTGDLSPNTFASDRELCDRFSLSRTPVREAVIRLSDDKLVEVVPRKGVRVLPLLAEDVREIHQVTKALELEAALIVTMRHPAREELIEIETAVATMERMIEAGDRDSWAAADTRFHIGIVNAAGNRRLATIYNGLRCITDRARYFALHLRELPRQSTAEHREMLQAVLAGEPDRVERLYRNHWDRTTAEILELLERQILRPPSPPSDIPARMA